MLAQQAKEPVLLYGNHSPICFKSEFQIAKDSLPEDLSDYSVIYIFSTANNKLDQNDLERLVDYVEKGGNLYVGAENWPLQSEFNLISNFLFKKECYGNFSATDAQSGESGRLELDELERIPAGKSTTSIPLDPNLKVEAWIEDHPLIMSGLIGGGKLVLDGGYSRFYCSYLSKDAEAVWIHIQQFFLVGSDDTD